MAVLALIGITLLLTLFVLPIASNLGRQLFYRDPKKPPIVWHWLPLVGSTVSYGQDPYAFFFQCRRKYGDIFTFTLLGMKVTVYLGTEGNSFILNGKLKDLNAEEIYGPLTIPIFGLGVVYDVDNAKFMDQKRLLKDGFSTASLTSYVPLFVREVETYLSTNSMFRSAHGICDVSTVMSEIALYCAAGALQGREVREAFDATFATLYRHLDDGFAPINFMLPGLPLPLNRRRDHAQRTMAKLYMGIIAERRKQGGPLEQEPHDMLWSLIDAHYKDGTKLTDVEIANLMIALLMGGQHNTAATGTWIMLHLAHRPSLIEELRKEQDALGPRGLTYETFPKLRLHNAVIKETLRLHSPIHSVMRKVKRPLPVPGTNIVVPEGHVLLAAPSFPSRLEEYFPDAGQWDPYRWMTDNALDASNYSKNEEDNAQETTDYGYGAVLTKAANSPYLPFGAGRHRCVGETFAYTQLTSILATAVRLLQWEQVDPTASVPLTDYSSMFSRPMHPAQIRWKKLYL